MSSAPLPPGVSDRKLRWTFAAFLAFLLCSGIAAVFVIGSLFLSYKSVRHTYTVELALGQVDASLAHAGLSRMRYVDSGGNNLDSFYAARQQVTRELDDVQSLIADDPGQLTRLDQLRSFAAQRLAVLDQSIALQQSGRSQVASQAALSSQVARHAFETSGVIEQMKLGEDTLLVQRTRRYDRLFSAELIVLSAVFIFSIFLFFYYSRLLTRELGERRKAELAAQHLSSRLLRLQDEERRRFSRELHDSLGQNLMAAKMLASAMMTGKFGESDGRALLTLLTQCMDETRVLSHLLHPPLLDELGLVSAAETFIEGFAQRTGIQIATDIPDDGNRLPPRTELALFRILQEVLTNIHRHARTSRAEISIRRQDDTVRFVARDYGRGIPPATLERFQSHGSHVGVGLAGMRERVREQGGVLEISSDEGGTCITAIIPVRSEPEPFYLASEYAAAEDGSSERSASPPITEEAVPE